MSVGQMFFRSDRSCWYCKIDGKFKRLSPCEDDSKQLYQILLIEHGKKDPTVADGAFLYLEWVKKYKALTSYEKKKATLDTLVDLYGNLKASDLEPSHLNNWVAKRFPKANPTTVNDRFTTVKSAWKWLAEENKRIDNQIAKMKKPACQIREFYVPEAQWRTLLAACSKTAKPIIEFMLQTGARPQEAMRVQIDQWKKDQFQIRASQAKGGKKARQILVPSKVIPLVEKQIANRTSGHVFLNRAGRPWNKSSLNCIFRRLKTKLNMPELCAYTMRHSFAAAKVAKGIQMEVVAKLLGHTSTRMVYQRYGHLDQQQDLLRAALE